MFEPLSSCNTALLLEKVLRKTEGTENSEQKLRKLIKALSEYYLHMMFETDGNEFIKLFKELCTPSEFDKDLVKIQLDEWHPRFPFRE